MIDQASFALRSRNPDVLTCIANLSNDEVFTPPEFANRMLDTLAQAWAANHGGANLWANKTVKFLDPCTKSGVFLRETRWLAQFRPALVGADTWCFETIDPAVTGPLVTPCHQEPLGSFLLIELVYLRCVS